MSDTPPPPPPGQQPPPPPPPPPDGLAPPPGYVAYGAAPTPAARIGRLKGLSTGITVLVAIAGVGGVLSAFLQANLRSDAEDLLAGRISDDDFNEALLSSSAFSALGGVATLAAMVLVMIWMYRIATNLRAFGINTTWHPLFAIFGWFLPPGVLYIIPLLMLREQWGKSTRSAIPGQPDGTAPAKEESPVLWIWWLAFGIWPLVALFLSAGTVFGNFGDTSADAVAQNVLDASQAITLIGGAIGVVAAVAWILFVRQMTARHQALTGEN